MAQGTVGNASGKAVILKNSWVGDTSGKARKIVKGWVGDASGKARLCYSSGMKIIPRTISLSSSGKVYYVDDGSTTVQSATTNLPANYHGSTNFINGQFAHITCSMSTSTYPFIYWVSDDGITWSEKGHFSLSATTAGHPNYATLIEAPNGTIYFSMFKNGSWTPGKNGTSDAYPDSYDYYLIYSKDHGSTWTISTYTLTYDFNNGSYPSGMTPTQFPISHPMFSTVKSKTGETLIWTGYGAGIVISRDGTISTNMPYFTSNYVYRNRYDDSILRYNDLFRLATDGTNFLRLNSYNDAYEDSDNVYYNQITGDWTGRPSGSSSATSSGHPLHNTTIYGYVYFVGYGGEKTIINVGIGSTKNLWATSTSLTSNTLVWTKSSSPQHLYSYTYDGSRYLFIGSKTYYSLDGVTLTRFATNMSITSSSIWAYGSDKGICHGSFCGGRAPA